jgi:hypothetical protein
MDTLAIYRWSSSKITALNSLSTSPVQAIPSNVARIAITFHNPGVITAYVCPSNITGSLASLGGCYVIFPGSDMTIYGGAGPVNGIWLAFSASGSGNPLTVSETIVQQ